MERRKLDFRDFNDLLGDLQRLRGGYLRAGNWTLSQVCDHLAIFFRGSLDGFGRMMPWLVRVTLGKLILRSILRNRGMRSGVKVPAHFLPGDPREDAAAADELAGLVERFRRHEGPLHPSPLFGRLSREQWTELHLIHASHHMSFLVPEGRSGD